MDDGRIITEVIRNESDMIAIPVNYDSCNDGSHQNAIKSLVRVVDAIQLVS